MPRFFAIAISPYAAAATPAREPPMPLAADIFTIDFALRHAADTIRRHFFSLRLRCRFAFAATPMICRRRH